VFDIGFAELMVIAVVGLIVLGPERLPKVARTAGHLMGRLQRYVGNVKDDINREMQIEELRKLQAQVEAQARDMEHQVNEQLNKVESDLNHSILDRGPAPPAPPTPDSHHTTPTTVPPSGDISRPNT